jgi:excisionase family DNA binding protein
MGESTEQPGCLQQPPAALRDILSVVLYLKLAIDDLREQLSSKRKSHYTVGELADVFGRSPFTVRRWITEGRIKAIRVEGTGPRGRLLVSRDQLQALLANGMAGNVPDAVIG